VTVAQDHAVDLFVAAGLIARDADVLPDALAELAVRLDLAGAGPLLDELTRSCFGQVDDSGQCPLCGHKKPPGDPHPKPPPPPPPPPPKGPK
jgi:hypothetical protein